MGGLGVLNNELKIQQFMVFWGVFGLLQNILETYGKSKDFCKLHQKTVKTG